MVAIKVLWCYLTEIVNSFVKFLLCYKFLSKPILFGFVGFVLMAIMLGVDQWNVCAVLSLISESKEDRIFDKSKCKTKLINFDAFAKDMTYKESLQFDQEQLDF